MDADSCPQWVWSFITVQSCVHSDLFILQLLHLAQRPVGAEEMGLLSLPFKARSHLVPNPPSVATLKSSHSGFVIPPTRDQILFLRQGIPIPLAVRGREAVWGLIFLSSPATIVQASQRVWGFRNDCKSVFILVYYSQSFHWLWFELIVAFIFLEWIMILKNNFDQTEALHHLPPRSCPGPIIPVILICALLSDVHLQS